MNPPADARKQIVVGVADMAVSDDVGTELVTYSLGSCLGVVIYDPMRHIGGLLHSMLPDSSIREDRKSPDMFVDTGMPRLIAAACRLGADKKRLVVKVVGGARVLDDNNYFRIGERNYEALRQTLLENGLQVGGEQVGGEVSRSVRLEIATGKVQVTIPGQPPVFI